MMAEADSGAARRRSPRIEQRSLARVKGMGRDGNPLEREGEINQVSSHGIRMTIGADFPTGTLLEVLNPESGESGQYRVVWAVGAAGGRQMGLELVEGSPTLWGPEASDS